MAVLNNFEVEAHKLEFAIHVSDASSVAVLNLFIE